MPGRLDQSSSVRDISRLAPRFNQATGEVTGGLYTVITAVKGGNIMGKLELTPVEEKELLAFIERYLHDLRVEIANTDDKEFRRSLKNQESIIRIILERLKVTTI
jgi:hypothetical protein